MKQSRLYEVDGLAIDLARLATVDAVRMCGNSQYNFSFSISNGDRATWTTGLTDRIQAESSRNNLIKAWKAYLDERDTWKEIDLCGREEKDQQEEIQVDPIKDLDIA